MRHRLDLPSAKRQASTKWTRLIVSSQDFTTLAHESVIHESVMTQSVFIHNHWHIDCELMKSWRMTPVLFKRRRQIRNSLTFIRYNATSITIEFYLTHPPRFGSSHSGALRRGGQDSWRLQGHLMVKDVGCGCEFTRDMMRGDPQQCPVRSELFRALRADCHKIDKLSASSI